MFGCACFQLSNGIKTRNSLCGRTIPESADRHRLSRRRHALAAFDTGHRQPVFGGVESLSRRLARRGDGGGQSRERDGGKAPRLPRQRREQNKHRRAELFGRQPALRRQVARRGDGTGGNRFRRQTFRQLFGGFHHRLALRHGGHCRGRAQRGGGFRAAYIRLSAHSRRGDAACARRGGRQGHASDGGRDGGLYGACNRHPGSVREGALRGVELCLERV